MSARNDTFEAKLYEEIMVDCYDEEEQNMSWYYYAQDELSFPFAASIELKKQGGEKILKQVKVLDLADSSLKGSSGLYVEVLLDEYIIEVSLDKLEDAKGSEESIEVVEIWKYWVDKRK